MSMCGSDGTSGPTCLISAPAPNRAAASSRPETSWDDDDASIVTVPPGTAPRPRTTKGTDPVPVSEIVTPIVRSAISSGPTGRRDARGSPRNVTSAAVSAATGGTNRSTVPALPTSTSMPGRLAGPEPGRCLTAGAGSTSHDPGACSIRQPSALSAAAISRVSRATSGPSITVGRSERAASTRARFVMDFEPGRRMTARTGPGARGASQSPVCCSFRGSLTMPTRLLARVGAPMPRHDWRGTALLVSATAADSQRILRFTNV